MPDKKWKYIADHLSGIDCLILIPVCVAVNSMTRCQRGRGLSATRSNEFWMTSQLTNITPVDNQSTVQPAHRAHSFV